MEVHEVSDLWQRQEEALNAERLANGLHVGVAGRERTAGKSGQVILRAPIKGDLPARPISKTLELKVDMLRAVPHRQSMNSSC
jgi:hypothetical protein